MCLCFPLIFDTIDHPSVTQGYFGVVNKGIYKPKDISVAVKTCKETLTQKQTKTLLKEGRSLVDYDHPNIVKFIGIAAIRPPVMIVMEYVAGKGSCKLHVCKYDKSKSRHSVVSYLFKDINFCG